MGCIIEEQNQEQEPKDDELREVRSSNSVVDAILHEAEQRGLSFVEDNFTAGANGEELYTPHVDQENAILWIKEKLEELSEGK
jgi:hypothetical protein